MTSWLIASALAADPVVSTDDDGVVRASVVVTAPATEALALIRDPMAMHALTADGSQLTATPEGACYRIAFALDTPIADVAYTARGCPTDRGFRSELVASESFRSLSSEWTVRELPAGTEVSYVYRGDVALPVPEFILRRSTQKAITRVMERVAGRLNR